MKYRPALEALEDRLTPAVPVLNSLPGAPATIYLDFLGGTESTWGTYPDVTTPAYDTDGDPAELTSLLAAVRPQEGGTHEQGE